MANFNPMIRTIDGKYGLGVKNDNSLQAFIDESSTFSVAIKDGGQTLLSIDGANGTLTTYKKNENDEWIDTVFDPTANGGGSGNLDNYATKTYTSNMINASLSNYATKTYTSNTINASLALAQLKSGWYSSSDEYSYPPLMFNSDTSSTSMTSPVICFSAELNMYVAYSENTIMYSSDAKNWNNATYTYDNTFTYKYVNAIEYDNTPMFIAFGVSGSTSYIFYSTDGVTWQQQFILPISFTNYKVAYSSLSGESCIALGITLVVLTNTASTITNTVQFTVGSVCADSNGFIAIGNDGCAKYNSTTQVWYDTISFNYDGKYVNWLQDLELYVAVGVDNTTTQLSLLTSIDGTVWINQNVDWSLTVTLNFDCATWIPELKTLVVAARQIDPTDPNPPKKLLLFKYDSANFVLSSSETVDYISTSLLWVPELAHLVVGTYNQVRVIYYIKPYDHVCAGRVGINTTSPQAELDVEGSCHVSSKVMIGLIDTMAPVYPLHVQSSLSNNDNTADISIYCTGDIYTSEGAVITSSDRRIKQHVSPMDGEGSLQMMRDLQPVSFTMIDDRLNKPHIGYIAQDVESVLDGCISYVSSYIPNVYDYATVTLDSDPHVLVTLSANANASTQVLIAGTRVRLCGVGEDNVATNKWFEVQVQTIVDDKSFTVQPKPELAMYVATRVFVYGTYVTDFHTLDKDVIFTVATSALKQLDKELHETRERLEALELRLTNAGL